MRKILLLLGLLILPLMQTGARAQDSAAEISQAVEDDKGFITRLLEENLSGAGRQVIIEGFRGALSSRATYDKITIADADGIWLTLKDGAIHWNRAALLRRQIEIAELSAKEILLPRLPASGEKRTAEAPEFALPQLPVGIRIEQILAERVELGEPVIGLPAALKVAGTMQLAGGEGSAQLTIDRLDGPRGHFVLDAGYANETRVLKLDLKLDEDADGLLVNLVDLHDKPSVKAEIGGEGPLSDFTANIQLATNGQPRVTGRASAKAEPASDGAPGTGFRLELGGDVASLLPPDDRTFFGTNTQLLAEGWRGQDGRLQVPVLMIDTNALNVSGSLTTNANGAPQSAVLLMTLGADAGATELPVKLPFGGGDTTVNDGRLELQYDASQGDGWRLTGKVGQIDGSGLRIGSLDLSGSGTVGLADDRLSGIDGRIEFGARGLDFDDPALTRAIGEQITGATDFDLIPGDALRLEKLTIDGSDYGLAGQVLVKGLRTGITASGEIVARYEELSRLSQLAGRPVTGSARADLSGSYVVLTHGFDVKAGISGTDISVDHDQLDRLLAGESRITLQARRDAEGITLSELLVKAQRLTASANGYLNSDSSDLKAVISMPSLQDADAELGGSLEAQAFLSGRSGARRLTVSGEAQDLKTGIAQLDGALLGKTNLTVIAGEQDAGYVIEEFQLGNPQLRASGQGNLVPGQMDAKAEVAIPDLAVLGRGWSGGLTANATLREEGGTRFLDVTGLGRDLSLGQANVDGALTGETRLSVRGSEKAGIFTIEDAQILNEQAEITAQGVVGGDQTNISGRADLKRLAALGTGMQGSLVAEGRAAADSDGAIRVQVDGTGRDLAMGQQSLDAALSGPTEISLSGALQGGVFTIEDARVDNANLDATASGKIGAGTTDLAATLTAGDLRFLGRGISGSVALSGRVVDQAGARQITAKGSANGLAIGQDRLDPLLRGQTTLDLAATQKGQAISIQRLVARNPQLQINADGDTASGINLDLRLADVALLQPGFQGPAQVSGTVRQSGDRYEVNLSGTAPGDTRAQVSGSAAADFSTLDLRMSGVSDAALANPLIRTRAIEGPISFDLRLAGAPAVESLAGTVNLTDGRISEPRLGISMSGLNLQANFRNGLINIDGGGNLDAGGSVRVNGPVDLRNGTVDIGVVLDNAVARDPNLYQATMSGNVRLSGGRATGQVISGQIDISQAEIRIPSTGMGGAKAIPDINHVGDTRPVRATRAKAGLEPLGSAAARDAGLAGPPATPPANPPRLDLVINAPNQVFIRGRGVDAEVGGRIQVQGTTRNVVPIGTLELIRGRVDLLGKRFVLTEGLVELQGSLVPVLRLVAETSQDSITTRIIIDGEARDPEITFESSPEMPEEEVLSQLLFRRGLDKISPLQAAQLANAVAVLAGRGGEGIIGNLRNQVGLDDLDLATDDEGNVQVRAGKYLTDNLYTDVAVGDDGKTQLNLNLDVSETLRTRGSVSSDGESTIGVYFERDY